MSYGRSHLHAPRAIDPIEAMEETQAFWEQWAAGCTYKGPYREAVERSLITLKALTYRPTGGIVAAATTSLPEQLGGPRNWDYRYCWLRDATFTLLAFMHGGYFNEAKAWQHWLLRAIAGSPDQVQIMYGIAGQRYLPERTLTWLSGYENSQPVRVGNAASEQLQLDIYGEVLGAFHQALSRLGKDGDLSFPMLRGLVEHLESIWQQPDDGIWETRGGTKTLHLFQGNGVGGHRSCHQGRGIVACQRAGGKMAEGPGGNSRRGFAARAYNEKLGSFVQSYGSDQLDASLLLIPMTGFLPVDDLRIKGTIKAIEGKLMPDGMVLRYNTAESSDGLPPGEGVFLACSFWMVGALKLEGRDADAKKLFERVLSLANDVGLLAEEYGHSEQTAGRQLSPGTLAHRAGECRLLPCRSRGSVEIVFLVASNWRTQLNRRRNGMHVFRVWAPNAKTMEVQIGKQKFAMASAERGWWSAEVASAGPGTDYGFVIDGQEPPVPDPRTRWQPNGVHAASRLVDDAAYVWSDRDWQATPLASALIYELHVGTFTPEGTFEAAEARLDYLKDLGVTHVELMPIANFPGTRGWGYDGVNLYAPFSAYGAPDDLKKFVNACHNKGLAVLLDVVYNHLGPVGNYLGKFGPYFTDHHSTPWGGAVNFEEAGSTEVRRYLIDNALMWLSAYHIDGLRLDAVHAFNDRSAIHFLEQLAGEVKRLEAGTRKHLVLIAESDLNDPRIVKAEEAGGYGLDAQWSDDFHHALFSVVSGESDGYYADYGTLSCLAKALRCVFVYDGGYSEYRGRNHGRPVVGLSGSRFVGFVQNHDQVGNRAKGERLSHETSTGRSKIAGALVLTAPFVPMLFQGEEFGTSAPFLYFTHFEDPELGRLISEGRKKEFVAFGWSPDEIPDPQEEQTFKNSILNWSELGEEPHASLLKWHRDLIRLRCESSELSDGNLNAVHVRFDEVAQWLVLERGPFRIACNFAQAPAAVEIGSGGQLLLASDDSVSLGGAIVQLGPDSVAVVKMQ